MKKHLLLGMAAIASWFATSCQNEIESVNAGKTSTVSFKVETPEIKSRAFSDGKTATVLQYAVYDEEGNELKDLTVDNGEIDIKTTVNLKLTTGNTYSVIFWAAAPDAPYKVDFANKTMKVDYNNAVSNDENRDAFYKYHIFTVKGAQTETIELKRPFAQLNIGTNDFEASKKAGYIVKQSSVKVPVYSTLNMEHGTVDGLETREFKLANIPAGEDFPVQGYKYLAMNYLLVSKETVDVEFTYTDGDDAKTRTVGSVPVQRNYRTNIYGQLLTSDVDINVEIKPEYNEPAHEADALYHAAAFGGEVTLTEDVELKTPLNIQANMILNLNGKTISGAIAKGAGAVVNVAEGVTAKIDGGTINSTVENGDAAINNAGKLVLEGVTINGAPLADGGYSAYAVISSGNLVIEEGTVVSADRGCIKVTGAGETVINGGTFTNKDINPRTLTSHVVDVEDGSTHKLTINSGTFQHLHATTSGGVVICNRTKGTVYVNGGNFSGGYYYGNNNLSDYGYGGTFSVKGGTYTAKPADEYIADGYRVFTYGDKYVVVANDVNGVKTADELAAALKAEVEKINVVLLNDIDLPITSLGDITAGSGEYKLGGENTKNITIDLNGHKLNVTTTYWSAIGAKNDDALFTIKNGTMTSTGNSAGTWNAWDVRFSNCNYEFENVKFEKAVALDNVDRSTKMKDVTITDTHNTDTYGLWITAEGQKVTLEDCTIDMLPATDGRGIKIDNQYVAEADQKKVTLNIKDVTIKSDEKAAIVVKSVAGAEINVSNLNINEVAEDNINAVWVDEDAKDYAEKVIVKGASKYVEGTVAKE